MMFYVQLNHGALVIEAPSREEAIEKYESLDRGGEAEPAQDLQFVQMPEITYVDEDNGFQFHAA